MVLDFLWVDQKRNFEDRRAIAHAAEGTKPHGWTFNLNGPRDEGAGIGV
jgi:hypothetical protein